MKNYWVIPTDKPSRLWINNLLQGKLELSKEVLIGSNTAQHIYITSEEAIKEGDWFIRDGSINKCFTSHETDVEFLTSINSVYCGSNTFWSKKLCKKIILTTDQDLIADGVQPIDNEFLEWFVKNPSCEFVEVRKYHQRGDVSFKDRYRIIIPQESTFINPLIHKTMRNVHILPTDKPSRLHLIEDVLMFTNKYKTSVCDSEVNIYITSDEEIKQGDWFIHPDSSCFDKECKEVSIGGYEILRVIKVDENFIYHSAMMAIHKNKNIKKIILTDNTDLIADGVQAIPNEFLEWLVKNPKCESVEVVKEMYMPQSNGKISDGKITHELSLNPSDNTLPFYKIIIPSEEYKMTLEEEKEFRKKFPKEFALIDMVKLDEAQEEPKQETLEDSIYQAIGLAANEQGIINQALATSKVMDVLKKQIYETRNT